MIRPLRTTFAAPSKRAYRGKPVYLWAKDQKPGDKTGDGVNKVWHVAMQ